MKIFTKFLPILLLLITSGLFSQNNFFTPADSKALPKAVDVTKNIRKMSVLRLDEKALRKYLGKAPIEFQNNGVTLPLEIPLPDGTSETFGLVESSILSPEIAAQHPEIKSYTGNGLTHKEAIIRLTLTSAGFHAVVLDLYGEEIYFEHYSQADKDVYFNYFVRDAIAPPDYQRGRCGIELDGEIHDKLHDHSGSVKNNTGGTLRTFRLAMAANGEFTGQHGGTQASGFAVVVNYVATMNLVYRRELSVHFNLVSGTNLVYTNAATDPFTNGDLGAMLDENQANCDAVIGNANYDIGHVWGYSGPNSGGGLASFQAVCQNSFKAHGASGEGGPPYAQVFFDQLVLHEVGHQFGMSHSYNSSIPVCTTRNPSTSVEPGAGATIMSYGFTCDTDDYFTSTTSGPFLNFHTASYDQADAYINSINCQTTTATGNNPPVVTMPSAYTIPKSTPFALTGSADTPGAGDSYTYSWEGTDIGEVVPDATTLDDTSKPPFFRSYAPSASGATRTYPILSAILDGTNQAKGDKLPSISKATTHRLTVRDNNTAGGGLSYGEVTITINGNIGPFLETTNLAGTYNAGSSQTITWSVNGTNVATPNINILLSIDGGQTFPTTLVANTPNDGSQSVILPNIQTITARIKVEAVGNIFFDISNSNFTISIPGCTAASSNICPTDAMTFDQGDAGLNLGLSNYYGEPVSQYSFNLTAGSPTGELANSTVENGPTCQTPWGTENYEVLDFAVSATGSYTFNDVTNSIVYSVFLSAGFNPAAPCSGTFIGSNAYGTITWNPSRTLTLTQCTTYKLVVWTLNANYGVKDITMSGAGSILSANTTPGNTGYTYVAVNTANNQITAQSATSDFTSLAVGTYKVYGASYKNGGPTPPANANPAGWIGQTLSAVQSSECVVFSSNFKSLTVNPIPCTPPAVTAPTVTQPTCATPTGTIVVNATGNGTLEYSVDNGATWQAPSTFAALAPGSYNIKVRLQSDPNCMTEYTQNPVVLNAATGCCTPPVVTAPTVTQPTCATPTGTIVVNATGGGTLEYSVDNGATWQAASTFDALAPGSYNIKVRLQSDPNCMTEYTQNPVVLNAATGCCTPPAVTAPTVTQPTCATPTGTIVVNATGGGTLEYSVDNGATWQAPSTFAALAPGSYNIKVRLQSDPNCMTEYTQNPVIINSPAGATYNGNVAFYTQAQVDAWSSCYTVINGYVNIVGASINNLGPLSNITQITGNLVIQSTAIPNMNGLNALTNIGGTLQIIFNSSLTSLDGLNALSSVGTGLFIYYNFQLSDCCAISSLLNGPGVTGSKIIFYNKVGCNSVIEVISNCVPPLTPPSNSGAIAVQSISSNRMLALFPNPAKGKVTVEVQKGFGAGSLRILDLTGRIVHDQQLVNDGISQMIDIEGWMPGIYLVQLQMDGEILIGKLVVSEY